jgi:hypothetical protein
LPVERAFGTPAGSPNDGPLVGSALRSAELLGPGHHAAPNAVDMPQA